MSAGSNVNITCYKCRGIGHTRKFCPSRIQGNDRRVNACSRSNLAYGQQSVSAENVVVKPTVDVMSKSASSLECIIVDHVIHNAESMAVTDRPVDSISLNDNNIYKQSYVASYDVYRDFVSLQYVNISVDELNTGDAVRPIRSLEDSGTELCVINPNLLESVVLPKLGTVRLHGIVGDPVSADLVKLHISLVESNNGVSHSIPIVCAVCPGLNKDLILTSALI